MPKARVGGGAKLSVELSGRDQKALNDSIHGSLCIVLALGVAA